MVIGNHLQDYQKWLSYRGIADSTIEYYVKAINRFIQDQGDLKPRQLKKHHLVNWILRLKVNAQNGFITNYLWAMRSFLKFLHNEKKINVWHFEDLKIPKRERKEYIEHLENKEVKQMLKSIKTNNVYGLRLRAYLETLLNTGMRPSEAINLNTDIVEKKSIKIIGKGGKEREIYFNQRSRYWLSRYMEERNDNCQALFVVNHYGTKRIKLRTIEFSFKKFFKELNINKDVKLHTMRHTYATNLLRNGCPPDYIRRLLGHSKIDTTRIYYLSITQKDVMKSHYKYLNYEK
jgi:integrase/recombinase XerD